MNKSFLWKHLMLIAFLLASMITFGYACSSSSKEVKEEPIVGTDGAQEEAPQVETGTIMEAIGVTNIREARGKTSKVVGKLKAGQRVKVSSLEDNWYAVFDPGRPI